MLTDTVAPDSWREAGGTVGTLRELGGMLIVTQSKENLASVRDVLQRLHRALHATDFPPQTAPRPATQQASTSPATQPVLEFINVEPLIALLQSKTGTAANRATITDDLVKSIIANIDPESWRESGGSATINVLGGILVVTQTQANQQAHPPVCRSASSEGVGGE